MVININFILDYISSIFEHENLYIHSISFIKKTLFNLDFLFTRRYKQKFPVRFRIILGMMNRVTQPVRTGWVSKASLYSIPVSRIVLLTVNAISILHPQLGLSYLLSELFVTCTHN